jgi:hypothetical protein
VLVLVSLQANTFVIMSVALRQMADSQWPGMADQGVFWFTDLTHPSILLSNLTCPYGVAGTLLPVAMLFLYLKTVQQSPGMVQCRASRQTEANACCVVAQCMLSGI